jgi:hypothetical protein
LINTTTAGDRSINGVSTVSKFIDLLDKQQQKEERRLIEKLTAGRSIDGISTGRRSIDIKRRREQSNSPTEGDRSIDGISTVRGSIDSK